MDLIANNLFKIKDCHYLMVLEVFTSFPWYKRFGKSLKTHQVLQVLNDIFLTSPHPMQRWESV